MFKNLFDQASKAVTSKLESTQTFFDSHKESIEDALTSVLVKIAEDHLSDERHMTSAFETVHGMLPLPLRLGIRQATFVEYCHAHKKTLLLKVEEKKVARLSASEATQDQHHPTQIENARREGDDQSA